MVLSGDLSVTPPRLRAPQGDGEILAYPAPAAAGDLAERNRAAFAAARVEIDGFPLPQLRWLAIAEVVHAAYSYLDRAFPPPLPLSLFLAGHQPELFHPGVWVKSFALNGLARRHGAVPLNLVVDNDTAKVTTIRV